MTIADPTFSVVVNTIERAGPLRTLLKALEQQSYPHFEVVVVVGPTHDNTLEVLAEYESRIRLLHCPTANLSRSRNIGLLAAHGEVVAFIDDDAVPCRRWLEQYARLLKSPSIAGLGGTVWAAHPRFSMLQFRLGIYSSLAEQVDVRHSWLDHLVPPGMASQWVARIPGGNTAIRRQALLELGGFDEFYEFVAEEADLTIRMANAGRAVLPVKGASIYHVPASGPNRVVFTNKGRWWMRSRSRVYLGLKNGWQAGDAPRAIILRSLMSVGAHFVWYGQLLRDRQFTLLDFLVMSASEVREAIRALVHGLFKPRQLIDPVEVAAARGNSASILPFQDPGSSRQPAVDPITGSQPAVSMPEPPMRLCLLSNTYPPEQFGGIASLTHLMARGLFELGHTVHVITRGDREQVSFYDGAYVHKIPNRQERYKQYRQYNDLFSTLNYSHAVYDKVKELELNDGIQIVDSPIWQYEGLVTLMSGILPVVVRLVTGLRQITKIHKHQVEEFNLIGDLEQTLITRASHLMPNTQATFNAMQKFYDFGSIDGRCTVVPYGIVPVPDDQARPFDLDRQGDTFKVLYVGRMEKRKGILDLFAAIPAILDRVPGAQFTIAGSDNSMSDGFKLKTGMDYPTYFASRYPGCCSQVRFTGSVSDEEKEALYQSCDLFVAPSLYESFGLVYLEAMNYAKAVIGCRAGGIPEVVDHGVTGYLVEPEAPQELSETIVSLLGSPARLRDLGLAGREQVLERFNYLQMARNFAQVYRRVIRAFPVEAAENGTDA
jgi:glycogen(starch) synthase